MSKLRRLAILIPAHNEETVIADTIKSCLKVVTKQDIYIVDDGSTDKTAQISKKYVPHVLSLKPNQGKAEASNTAIAHFKLATRYEYLLPMDADTQVSQHFLEQTLPPLDRDKKQQIACVVGKVIGLKHNFLTTYRIWEYEISQLIHKNAQAKENAIIVCPGCATVYRASIFQQIKIPTGTLTEDMDLTFLIHRQNLGRIVFREKAVVITQDPQDIRNYVKQIDRWYTGFWQCVSKHNIPWAGQPLDAEVAMLATEGLFNGILTLTLIALIPFAFLNHPEVLAIPFLLDLAVFMLPTFFLVIKRHKHWKIFAYLPQFYLIRLLSCLIFLVSFIKVTFGLDKNMSWRKIARYAVTK